MHVLHEGQQPEFLVFGGLEEAADGGSGGFLADCVSLDAGVREDAFFWGEPDGIEGVVGEDKDTTDGDDKGYGSLDDAVGALVGLCD